MVIRMKAEATVKEMAAVLSKIQTQGFMPHVFEASEGKILGVTGKSRPDPADFGGMPGVAQAKKITSPYKLASAEFKPESTAIRVNGCWVGREEIVVMAGPCSVESRTQILEIAALLRERGVKIMRGGAYKPRSSPYAFQGLKEEGLEYLAEAKQQTGIAIVTEVMAPEDVPKISRVADILQVGARNMQNFPLLEAVGKIDKPVLLKRGMMATIEELLMAAEYILSNGNRRVILCERGIRTFERQTRNTFDITAIPVLKQLSHLPVIADPSHGTGHRDLVIPVSRAAVAAGADGLLIEVHQDPDQALCDGAQSLTVPMFTQMMQDLAPLTAACGRRL